MKINEHIYLVGSGRMGFDWTHPSDCNVYLLHSEGELALIDTGTGASIKEIFSHIEDFGYSIHQLEKVFLTHVHADHAGGAMFIKEKTDAKIYVHEQAESILKTGDEEKIDLTTAKRAGFYPEDYRFQACIPDMLLKEGDQVSVGNLNISVLETPGHSAFDLAFYIKNVDKEESYLFSGDTIFYDGKISMIATSDFNLRNLQNSIKKLSELSVDLLLPGHYNFTLQNGDSHILKANEIFKKMGIPSNINE